jgi:uncharacterized C2H2 Zn-finger protein
MEKNHTCPRCGYSCVTQSDFRKHLNRKKICSPTVADISIDDLKKKYERSTSTKKDEPKNVVLPIKTKPIENQHEARPIVKEEDEESDYLPSDYEEYPPEEAAKLTFVRFDPSKYIPPSNRQKC